MIEIIDLVKNYGDLVAVDHLDLTIEPGKIYGLLGRNGAGKSTTMNILTGYIAPSSGTVQICGHDIFKEANEAKKSIGYLPEIPPLYTDMTVYEYLCFAAELKGFKKKELDETVYEVMEKTGIESKEKRLIRNLSKGYRQRVGLAQALIGYPDIIILDEPTVGLDVVQIIEMRDLIKELGKEHTVILSSHILQEINAVCDYVYIIDEGRLMDEFSMDELETEGFASREQALEDRFVNVTSGRWISPTMALRELKKAEDIFQDELEFEQFEIDEETAEAEPAADDAVEEEE